jgi:hypothetical protein
MTQYAIFINGDIKTFVNTDTIKEAFDIYIEEYFYPRLKNFNITQMKEAIYTISLEWVVEIKEVQEN